MDAEELRARDLAAFLRAADLAKVDLAAQEPLEGKSSTITTADIDRIVEMAWEDRTTFDTIYEQFGILEAEVIKIMRKSMKRSSFLMWRERVQGRKTKHAKTSEAQRFCCDRQSKPKERRKSR